MRVNGLTITYRDGINTLIGGNGGKYPAGDLLCLIFQGENLYEISRIVRNCITFCPMRDNDLSQDEIEEAERYMLAAIRYNDFYPAYRLAQGSFIRVMENYRALDKNGIEHLLTQESLYDIPGDMYFSDVGFDTVGEFLQLCFNHYYDDLEKGMDVFRATSAIWSGTATEDEQAFHDWFREALRDEDLVPGIEMRTSYTPAEGSFRFSHVISSFLAMAVFEFSHLAEAGTKIMRCQNPACGKFFTARRATAKYCGFEAPQCPGRTCSDFYPQIVYREKVRSNELERLVKNTKCRLYNARRRHPDQAEKINAALGDLAIDASFKMSQVLEKTISTNEFREWLDSH